MRRLPALLSLCLVVVAGGRLLAQAPAPDGLLNPGAESGCCGYTCDCPSGPCFYASAEYLLWWIKAAPVPVPLLTASGDPVNNPRAIIGQPTTQILFGGRDYDFGPFAGGRVTAGWQLAPGLALEGSGFLLEQQARSFSVRSDAIGNPVLATPFFDAVNNREFSSFYSLPTPDGGSAGFVINQASQLWSAESNLSARVVDSDMLNLNLVMGFRYLDLREKLRIDDVATFFAPTEIFQLATFPSFSTFPAFDEFKTRNQFYGGQLGAQAELHWGAVSLGFLTQVALGSTHEVLRIDGATQALPPGATASALTVPGDAFALLSNIGRVTHNEFTVVPEVRLSLAYQLTDWLSVFAGYNFLYVSNVLRPGDQIDPRWNPSLIPTFGLNPSGPALPAAILHQTDFFAHGLNFGVGVRF